MEQAALWQLGFRPCFLLANSWAIFAMAIWLLVQNGMTFPGLNQYGGNYWHAHELIFAYGMMVIAGFLLTAIKNWTGIATANGKALQCLVASWLIARLAFFIPGIPFWALALTDLLFPLLLTVFVAQPLIKAGNKRNYMMILIVALLGVFNAGFHLSAGLDHPLWATRLLLLPFMLILLLIAVIAGRVFPMFSQNGVDTPYQAKIHPLIEKMWPLAMVVLVVVWVFFAQHKWPLFIMASANALIHGWRLLGWHNKQIWQKPLVWVLHVGYAFLVVGFIGIAILPFYPWMHFLTLHVLTMGCFGMITLGMMARVSWGHSGRNLRQPPKVLGLCFGLMLLATCVRVFLPMTGWLGHHQMVLLSGLLWILAFSLFLIRYSPVWIKPRVDGKPG